MKTNKTDKTDKIAEKATEILVNIVLFVQQNSAAPRPYDDYQLL